MAHLKSGSLAAQLSGAAAIMARIWEGESLADGLLQTTNEQDRPAIQDMVYSALRAYGWADAILAKLMQKPMNDLWVRAVMSLAMLRLQQRPQDAHTIVNQAVEAVAAYDERFKGLTNGVLRNFQRQRESLVAAVETIEQVRWAHPKWWVKHVQRDHRDHWQQILNAGNSHPPMALRVNRRKTNRDEWLLRAQAAGVAGVPRGEFGVLLNQPVRVNALPGFFEGEVSVQDLGAQQAAALLNPAAGSRVLDACAAPGGKTAHLLENADVDLLALDVSAMRCQRIDENLSRLNLQAKTLAADCRDTASWWDQRPFDAVLADVPCTASGVVRRHPDSKTLRQEADLRRFAKTQREILEALSPIVRLGGTLLYATCSVFHEENQTQISQFLQAHPEMRLCQELQLLPQSEHDGFYYALLERVG